MTKTEINEALQTIDETRSQLIELRFPIVFSEDDETRALLLKVKGLVEEATDKLLFASAGLFCLAGRAKAEKHVPEKESWF